MPNTFRHQNRATLSSVFLTSTACVLGTLMIGAAGCRPRARSASTVVVYPAGTALFMDLDSAVCADTYKLGARLTGHIAPKVVPEPPHYSLPDYSPVLLKLVAMRPEPQFVVLGVTVNGKSLLVQASTATSTDVESRSYVARTLGTQPTVLCIGGVTAELLSPLVVPTSTHTPE